MQERRYFPRIILIKIFKLQKETFRGLYSSLMTECVRKRVRFQPTTKAGGIYNRVQKELFLGQFSPEAIKYDSGLLNLFEHNLNQHSPHN